jgi:hypothetical protein
MPLLSVVGTIRASLLTTLNDLGFKHDVGPHLVERYVRHVLSTPLGLQRNRLGYTTNE